MADKSTTLVLDARSRAVADPAGLPLHGSKASGLFATTAPAKQAAELCKQEGYLRVVRTETKGKTTQEICALTEKGLAYLLSRMVYPRFPECVGIYRCVERPCYDDLLNAQVEEVIKAKGKGKLEELFASEDTWVVE